MLLKIAAGAIAGALCATVLRKNSPEFVVPIVLVAGGWILCMSVQTVSEVTKVLSRLVQSAQLEMNLVGPVVKAIGLSIVTRITVEVCRAAGEGGLAAFVDVAGTFLALVAALPLVTAVVEMIAGLTI